MFEYGVILNGSQTKRYGLTKEFAFEYGVILNGSQTRLAHITATAQFEYGVILNGSQTCGNRRNGRPRV